MTKQDQLLFDHFAQFVSDHKKAFIDKVLNERTRHVTVVLEDIFQSQNSSAVIRTCECMGLQDIHIVENKSKYHFNTRVLKGADKWLNLVRHKIPQKNNTESCFADLRQNGYRILVTDPSEDGISIHDVDVTESKLALVFGNELRGTSAYAIENADMKIKVPMYGFTESLNISVSAAMCLNSVITKLHTSGIPFGLDETEKQAIKLEWYRKVVRRSDIVEREFLRTIE